MRISPEIKEFTKNTLIFTLFFTLVIHLSWGYIAPYLSLGASAGNDANFTQANRVYMGNIATALSLNIGNINTISTSQGDDTSPEAINMDSVLSDAKKWEQYIISYHMRAIDSYVNLLKTDIKTLLDESTERSNTLDEHIEILKSHYIRTNERTLVLSDQSRELQSILTDTKIQIANAKISMEETYKSFESVGIDAVISSYVSAKTRESQARVYLAYVERFQRAYGILQWQNKLILDTLINNREALISKSVVVIPDSGSDILKKLDLVVTEEEYKANQTKE